jgi:hypothetical protein
VSGPYIQWYVLYWNMNTVKTGILIFTGVQVLVLAGVEDASFHRHPCMF